MVHKAQEEKGRKWDDVLMKTIEAMQLYKRPIPLNQVLKTGQQIKYGEFKRYKSKTKKTSREWRTGNVEFVSEYFAAVRDDNGLIYTFTATDVFTNDVEIEGYHRHTITLAEILGAKE